MIKHMLKQNMNIMLKRKVWFLEERILTFLTSLFISEQGKIYVISKRVRGGPG